MLTNISSIVALNMRNFFISNIYDLQEVTLFILHPGNKLNTGERCNLILRGLYCRAMWRPKIQWIRMQKDMSLRRLLLSKMISEYWKRLWHSYLFLRKRTNLYERLTLKSKFIRLETFLACIRESIISISIGIRSN